MHTDNYLPQISQIRVVAEQGSETLKLILNTLLPVVTRSHLLFPLGPETQTPNSDTPLSAPLRIHRLTK